MFLGHMPFGEGSFSHACKSEHGFPFINTTKDDGLWGLVDSLDWLIRQISGLLGIELRILNPVFLHFWKTYLLLANL